MPFPPVRFKRSICPTCGAPKLRPSQTAYVYCDHCGELSDYDFAKACERPMERPGPVYETLHAQMIGQLEHARTAGDVGTFRALQMRLFDVFVTACPGSVPLRVGDPAYRYRYVAYMAEGATVACVAPAGFHGMCQAVFAQQAHVDVLYDQRGVYAMRLSSLPGSRRIVCERCGHRVDVGAARVRCRGCGSTIAPAEGVASFACPHCRVPMQRVELMA